MRKGILFGKQRRLMSVLILFMAFLAMGCTTSYLEGNGKMANERSNNHVQPYEGASTQPETGEAVWLVGPHRPRTHSHQPQ